MDVAFPYTALCPTLDADVLVALAGTSRPLTGRQVARLVKRGSQTGVGRALRRLATQGIVEAQEAGPSILYSLNRSHLAAPAVEILANMRTELLRRMRQSLGGWSPPPVHASLFGSAARADGDERSDIDLFLVRPRGVEEDSPAWRDQCNQLARDILLWTGNRLGLAEVASADLRELRRKRPKIVSELRTDGITLAGRPISKLLGSLP